MAMDPMVSGGRILPNTPLDRLAKLLDDGNDFEGATVKPLAGDVIDVCRLVGTKEKVADGLFKRAAAVGSVGQEVTLKAAEVRELVGLAKAAA